MTNSLALVMMHLHSEIQIKNMCTAGKLENVMPFIMIIYDKIRLYAIRVTQ